MKFILSLVVSMLCFTAFATSLSYEKQSLQNTSFITDNSDHTGVLQIVGESTAFRNLQSSQGFNSYQTYKGGFFTGIQGSGFSQSEGENFRFKEEAISKKIKVCDGFYKSNRQRNTGRLQVRRIQKSNSGLQRSYTTVQNHIRETKRNHSDPKKVHPEVGKILGVDRWYILRNCVTTNCNKTV